MSLLDLLRALLAFLGFKKKTDRVVITHASIIYFGSDGTQEFMHWEDLAEVAALTGGEGLCGDVHIVLTSTRGQTSISIPQGAEGMDKLLAAVKMLPSFDSEVLAQTMGSLSVARFVCWQKGAAPGRVADGSFDNENLEDW